MNGCSRLHIRSDEMRCPAWEHSQAALPKGCAQARNRMTDSAAKQATHCYIATPLPRCVCESCRKAD